MTEKHNGLDPRYFTEEERDLQEVEIMCDDIRECVILNMKLKAHRSFEVQS